MSTTENQFASASYILNVYAENEALLRELGIYAQLKLELSKSNDLEKLSPEAKKSVQQAVASIRYYLTISRIRVKALRNNIDVFGKNYEKLQNIYDRCYQDTIPSFQDLEEYADLLNQMIVEGIVSELLVTAQKVYSQMNQNQTQSGGTHETVANPKGSDYPGNL